MKWLFNTPLPPAPHHLHFFIYAAIISQGIKNTPVYKNGIRNKSTEIGDYLCADCEYFATIIYFYAAQILQKNILL